MALTGSMIVGSKPVEGAYVRIKRILGGKDEGYQSVVDVFWDESYISGPALTSFNHTCAYVADENPYITMYKSIEKQYKLKSC